MQPIAAQVEDRVVPFLLPAPQKMIASPLLRLEGASAGYDAGKPILTELDLRIDQDDRIALLGQNGNGKSTFAKLIAGRLAPLTGNVFGAQKVEVGYFAQHQLDDLNPAATPYDYMREADAGRDGSAAAHAARHLRLRRGQGRHQMRRTCQAARRRGCCWR